MKIQQTPSELPGFIIAVRTTWKVERDGVDEVVDPGEASEFGQNRMSDLRFVGGDLIEKRGMCASRATNILQIVAHCVVPRTAPVNASSFVAQKVIGVIALIDSPFGSRNSSALSAASANQLFVKPRMAASLA